MLNIIVELEMEFVLLIVTFGLDFDVVSLDGGLNGCGLYGL